MKQAVAVTPKLSGFGILRHPQGSLQRFQDLISSDRVLNLPTCVKQAVAVTPKLSGFNTLGHSQSSLHRCLLSQVRQQALSRTSLASQSQWLFTTFDKILHINLTNLIQKILTHHTSQSPQCLPRLPQLPQALERRQRQQHSISPEVQTMTTFIDLTPLQMAKIGLRRQRRQRRQRQAPDFNNLHPQLQQQEVPDSNCHPTLNYVSFTQTQGFWQSCVTLYKA